MWTISEWLRRCPVQRLCKTGKVPSGSTEDKEFLYHLSGSLLLSWSQCRENPICMSLLGLLLGQDIRLYNEVETSSNMCMSP